eukprot:gene7774-9282_t
MSAPSTNMTAKLSKYAKMQTMFPECVIRQKMSVDGFTPSEIDSFLDNAPAMSAPTCNTSTFPTAKLEKYTKMRVILPENAVRQRMAADGFSTEMCDKFFASAPSETSAMVVETIRVTDGHFKKYMKMKSLFPECVLRQKMSVDGVSSSEIDAFLINGPPTGSIPPLCRPVSATRLVKYAKMKAMLPEAAVRQKMTVDAPSGTARRKQEASSVGTGIRHSASRLDRKTSSGTLSESDSSVASLQQTRLPRRSAHNTPASTNPKKNKANTPASTGTAGKSKRASVAAFGHGLRSPTSASIRELFEAQKKSHKAANAMPTPEQIAAGFYTQSYAQVHGGYMPPKHVFRPKHGTSDNEQSNLDSDSGSLRAHRPSRAHTSEGDEAAQRHRNRGRSTSPHSVISNASSKGSRASSVNRKRMAHNWVP